VRRVGTAGERCPAYNQQFRSARTVAECQIEAQRSRLAAVETSDAKGWQAVKDAFVAGYQMLLWIAAGMGIASSMIAAALISHRNIALSGPTAEEYSGGIMIEVLPPWAQPGGPDGQIPIL
jgi:hypothetical protein